ncbi:MAG TPA: hypothetical protein VNU68_32690 [Verrucomicrobiae bacterium]|nr:hypothetical protein [Verrucomicrobiae bacterium]
MCGKTIFWFTSCWVLATGVGYSQVVPPSQWFQITSGRYLECCGFGGTRVVSLPSDRQSFIKLEFGAAREAVAMTVLGADRQSVYNVVPCPAGDPIPFRFEDGLVFSDHVVFQVDPGPPPYQVSWNYTLSNSPTRLRLDGQLGLVQPSCADVPTRFSHSNVVAVLMISPPVIDSVARQDNQLQFRVVGEPGFDYFVEYSETWPSGNWLALTNFRAKLETVEALIADSPISSPKRFYRVRKEDCRCD